jgi:hypothetical protein
LKRNRPSLQLPAVFNPQAAVNRQAAGKSIIDIASVVFLSDDFIAAAEKSRSAGIFLQCSVKSLFCETTRCP